MSPTVEATLTPRAAAVALGVGLNHVYGLLYTNKLQGTRLNRRWQIPKAAIEERLRKVGRQEGQQ